MLTRLIGSDAVIEFSEDLLDIVRRAEAAFPAPDWAVLFNDSDDEEDADELVICRRYAGVLLPMAYVDIDEISDMEKDGVDWPSDLAADLARTDAEIETAFPTGDEGAETGGDTDA